MGEIVWRSGNNFLNEIRVNCIKIDGKSDIPEELEKGTILREFKASVLLLLSRTGFAFKTGG